MGMGMVQSNIKIEILPVELEDISNSVYKYLNLMISRYYRVFRGVVLCYTENVTFSDDIFIIVNNALYCSVNVEFLILSTPRPQSRVQIEAGGREEIADRGSNPEV